MSSNVSPEESIKKANSFAAYKEIARVYAEKILSLPNDSLEKTVVVALALCLVGAILVSGSAVVLKPLQEGNKSADMRKNILEVVGLLEDGVNIDEVFKNIETKMVDLASGNYIDTIDAATFDQKAASKDPALSDSIEVHKDIAHIKRRAKFAKVYLVKKDNQLQSVILPVSGYGLWSTMYGFMALERDGQTVVGLNLYDQAETPGLGGEVVNPKWKALWRGKKIYAQSGETQTATEKGTDEDVNRTGGQYHVELGLVKGAVDPNKPGAQHQVDALAGATLTSQGVTNLVHYWLSEEGFGPYLQKLRESQGVKL